MPGGSQGRFTAAAFAATGVAFVAMAGLHLHPYGGIRHCLPVTPLLWIVTAAGIASLAATRGVPARTALAVVCASLASLETYGSIRVTPGENRFQVSQVLAGLRDKCRANDKVAAVGWYAPPALTGLAAGDLAKVASLRATHDTGRDLICPDIPPGTVRVEIDADWKQVLGALTTGLAPGQRAWLIYTSELRADVAAYKPGRATPGGDEVSAPGCWATYWEATPP